MVLYRKYRPQTFAEMVGQEKIKEGLLAALQKGQISHAYLFSGPRGTGKTSAARILAKAVNCQGTGNREQSTVGKFGEPCNMCESCLAVANGTYLDLIEIDAASNRGIDEIRELREKIKLSPAVGRYKVYIIDEAHMLTHDAFNALLKTLEEPPPHAIFILATTEPQKIPATVASRTTKFDFHMPSVTQIKEKLESISKKEGWKIETPALEEIAKMGAGAFRDAEVLLEKVASVSTEVSKEKAEEILGKEKLGEVAKILLFIEEGRADKALVWLDDFIKTGGGVRVLAETMVDLLRKILLFGIGATQVLEPISEEENKMLSNLATQIKRDRIVHLTDLFNKAIENLRESTIPQLPIEMAIVEATLDLATEGGSLDPKPEQRVKADPETDVENLEGTPAKETETAKDIKIKIEDRKQNKRPASEDKILKKLEGSWDKVVQETKKTNSSLTHFLKEAKLVNIDEDLLTIEFGFLFHKQKAEEPKYREIIEGALEKVAGTALRFKGVVSDKPKPAEKVQEKQPQKAEEVDPVEVFGRLD